MSESLPQNNEGLNENETPETKVTFDTEGSTIFTKHEYSTKKPIKNAGKKRILICTVSLVLCVAIGASIFLVDRFMPVDNGSNNSSNGIEELSFKLLTAEKTIKESSVDIDGSKVEVATNISGVGIYNKYSNYAILPYYEPAEKAEESSASSSTSSEQKKEYLYDTKWYINGIDKNLTVTTEINSYITKCLNITASRKLENTFSTVEEYHEYYGIDDPTRVLTVEFNDGTEKIELLVGKIIATGDGNYVTITGDESVYIVSDDYIMNLDYLPIHFADKTMVPEIEKTDANKGYFNDEGVLARFDYIKISGSLIGDREVKFTMNPVTASNSMPYMMTSPYKRPANNEFIDNILEMARSGLDASSLYSFNCTDENFKISGFDEPKCVIEMKVGDYKFKVTIGRRMQEDSSGLSALVEGKPQIFNLDASTVDFLSDDITVMFNEDFLMENIYAVKGLTFKDNIGTYKFDISHKLQSGSDNVYDTFVKLDGKEMETASFKRIYQRVLLLSLLSFATEAEKTDTLVSITFDYIEGGKKIVEFTQSPNDAYHYIAWVDGVPLGEVLTSNITDITDNLHKYLNGETIPERW